MRILIINNNKNGLERKTVAESFGKDKGDVTIEPEGKGVVDGRSGEVQPVKEPGERRGIAPDASGQGIRQEGGNAVAGVHAELGSGSGAEGRRVQALEGKANREKETSESNVKTTDTDENPLDSRGDTALSRNSNVSEIKGSEKVGDGQISAEDNLWLTLLTS